MEMSLSTVAEWSGSAIISNLIDTAYLFLSEHILPADTESELRRVKAALPEIAAVMGVGEALKLKHPNSGVNAWLEQFKQAFLAADDVLDELKYWELADMVKNQDQVSGSSSSIIESMKRKLTSYTLSKDTLKRLRVAVEMLDMAGTNVGHFFQFATALDVHGLTKQNNEPVYASSRETTSFLTENKVVGREIEKAKIIEWLNKPASQGNISTFCIVGVGGSGKTTIAQLIFDETTRENYFDKTIWVCVSTSFNVKDITRKILQELGENGHDNESLNCLQIKLKEKIHSKKILFILDDVWNDDKMCDWEKLIPPFEFVRQGSKILLTTRMKSVVDMFARVLSVEREDLVLEGLKEQELLELLNKYAFCGDNPDNHRDLQKIGNDIVKKLRGNPLAAKMIGSLLNSNMNFHFWKRILNHDSLINLEQAKDVADVLKLSYCHLPAHLQECFRFCSIFYQDYEFNKDELIKMWMASGFIHQELHGDERPEDIGEEYFNDLFRKSFFERHSRVNTMFVMHDLLHDLAQIVSKEECCRVEFNVKYDIKPTTTHVSIHESKIEGVFNLRNLRTLVITMSEIPNNRDRFVVPNGALKETLRILVIDGIGRCELPDEIGRLIHLRFLKVNVPSVRQSFRYLLPNSIYKLYHLQVLEMSRVTQNSDYEGVETMRMTNMISLRYINFPNQVMLNIHRVRKLTSLQELNFTIGRESGHHIDELEMLNNLRSISIKKIENVGNPIGARNANLSKKESLISLSLNWTARSNPDNPEQVIDNLQPHLNLKKLAIENYTGQISPIWMRDSSHLDLTSLTLDHCPHWKVLPILGQLPHLKELSLCQMHEVREVDYSCNSTSNCPYPSLERLYCASIPKWESWIGPHSYYGFPNLKELFISYCPNLAKLPAIPFSLVKFDVTNVGLNSLPNMHHGSSITAPATSCMISSLRVLRIISCPKLISLDGFLQQQNLDLKAIEELKIKDCKNLLELPKEGFGKLTSMKNLFIENSLNLKKLPNLPLSLNDFTINYVAVSDLPEYFTSSQSSGPTSSSLKASLREVKIYSCSNLTSLNGFLQQENIELQVLETLIIYDCENLVQLPTDAFGKLVSLKHLAIKGSPKMLIVDHERILLPENLQYLEMENCGEVDVALLESASQLSSLAKLCIINCANISCIPSSENAFASLITLKIWGCDKLIEFSSTQQAHTINPGNNSVSSKISYLRIDHLSLLLIVPLRFLRFVSSLRVEKCSGMEALPEEWLLQNCSTLKELTIRDASSLRSLLGTMVMLTALEHLLIYKATSLEEIPKLPASMISENITRAELPFL